MPQLPNRTREHELETETERFVHQFLPISWVAEKERHDYGIDLRVEIVTPSTITKRGSNVPSGQVTGAFFSIQLKGSDNLKYNRENTHVSHRCAVSALNYYLQRPEIVIYLVYDATKKSAYWIYIQDYMREQSSSSWKKQETFTLKIPIANVFNANSLEEIKKRALERHDILKWLNASLSNSNPYYRYEFHNGESGITISVLPRYPGAEQECPITLKGTFRFDDSPEAQDALANFQNTIRTGAPSRIDAQFIEGFDMTDLLPDLFAHIDRFEPRAIEILPITSNEKYPVAITFLDEHARPIDIISYIEFRKIHGGTEEVTYSNEDQQSPLTITVKYNFPSQAASITFRADYVGKSAILVKNFLQLQQGIEKARSLRLTNLNTGMSVTSTLSKEALPTPSQIFLEFANNVAFIQERLNQIIIWRDNITARDVAVAKHLAQALNSGKMVEKPKSVTIGIGRQSAQAMIGALRNINEPFQLMFTGDNLGIMIMDTELLLGPFEAHLPQVQILSIAQNELRKATELPDEESLDLEIEILDPGVHYTLLQRNTSSNE